MICKKCGIDKPIEAYQIRKSFGGIPYRQCRDCRVAISNVWRHKNPDRVKASVERGYDRQSDHQQKLWASGYRVPSRRVHVNKPNEWVIANRDKYNAQQKVARAIKNKSIIRPAACENCSRGETRIYGHHQDYTRPLDVNWLCGRCHRRVHVGRVTIPPLQPIEDMIE